MKVKYTFTAQIEQDPETNLFVGYVPSVPGAHTQARTLDELRKNLQEVLELCLEEASQDEIQTFSTKFIGTQQFSVEA